MDLGYRDSVWGNFDLVICKRYFEVLKYRRPLVPDFKDLGYSDKSVDNALMFLNVIVRGGDARVTNMLIDKFDNLILWLMVASQKRIVLEITRIISEDDRMSRDLLFRRLNRRFGVNRELMSRSLKFLLELDLVESKAGKLKLKKQLLDINRVSLLRYSVKFLDFENMDVLNLLIVGGLD